MQETSIILYFALLIITLVVVMVGINLTLALIELRRLIKGFNTTFQKAEFGLTHVLSGFKQLSSYAINFETGVKTFQTLVNWLQTRQESKKIAKKSKSKSNESS